MLSSVRRSVPHTDTHAHVHAPERAHAHTQTIPKVCVRKLDPLLLSLYSGGDFNPFHPFHFFHSFHQATTAVLKAFNQKYTRLRAKITINGDLVIEDNPAVLYTGPALQPAPSAVASA